MALFRYEAIDNDGQLVAGNLEAASVQHARALIDARGLTTHSISRAASEEPRAPDSVSAPLKTSPTDQFTTSTHRPATAENLEETVLSAHMATILGRVRAIVPALRAYAAEMPAGWQRRQLIAVCRILERGNSDDAATALAQLPESWIPLLSAASTSPDHSQVLHDFLNESRRADALRQQWWLTLAYPVVLLGLATTVMTVLAIFIIPVFRDMFDDFDLQLPFITLAVLNIAWFLSHWGIWIVVALALVLAIVVLKANRLLPARTFGWLTNRVSLPFGRRTSIARFVRFTADLIESGVGLPDALRIAGFAVNRSPMQQAAWRLAKELESTGRFSQRAYERPLTASFTYALAADLPTESRVRLLREISNSHADRTSINLSWASGIVEPIAIFAVGLVIGLTVIGLFLPLVKLVEGLSH
jgi:type II secretory pathway component PulF